MFSAIHAFIAQAGAGHEVEFRCKDPTMEQGVDYDTFQRVQRLFAQNNAWRAHPVQVSEVIFYKHTKSNHQYRTVDGVPEYKRRVYPRKPLKSRLDDIEREYSIRCAESIEQKIVIAQPRAYVEVGRRHRTRKAYTNQGLRMDFTTVKQAGKVFFEIECEYIRASELDPVPVLVEIATHIQGGTALMKNGDLIKYTHAFKDLLRMRYPKFPAPLPRTLTTNDIDTISCGYSVTEKADGTRFLLYVHTSGRAFFIGRPKGKHLKLIFIGMSSVPCLIDGELVGKQFYAFDILHDGNDVRHMFLKDRLARLGAVVQRMRTTIKVHMKTFYLSHNGGTIKMDMANKNGIASTLRDDDIFITALYLMKKKHPYPLDGVIFTPLLAGYSNERIYKWKDVNTIDFYYTNGALHIAGNDGHDGREYVNLPFSGVDAKGTFYSNKTKVMNAIFGQQDVPASTRHGKVDPRVFAPFEGHVVECGFKNGSFYPIKRRDDKVMANNIKVVNDAWASIVDPVNLDRIDHEKYTCIRKYHNRIKKWVIEKHTTGKDVLDIGSGAGGDIQKYIDARATRVVGVDIVPVKYAHPAHMTFVHLKNAEYNIQDELKKRRIQSMFDVVNVHFAAHYFFKNEHTLHQFIHNIASSLRKGGTCCVTMMDGGMIHSVFETHGLQKGDTCTIMRESKPLFALTREYDSFAMTGNTIRVMLHGTTYFQDASVEYAADLFAFAELMKDAGLELTNKRAFRRFSTFPEHDMLHPSEKTFSYFNTVLEFTRV